MTHAFSNTYQPLTTQQTNNIKNTKTQKKLMKKQKKKISKLTKKSDFAVTKLPNTDIHTHGQMYSDQHIESFHSTEYK